MVVCVKLGVEDAEVVAAVTVALVAVVTADGENVASDFTVTVDATEEPRTGNEALTPPPPKAEVLPPDAMTLDGVLTDAF